MPLQAADRIQPQFGDAPQKRGSGDVKLRCADDERFVGDLDGFHGDLIAREILGWAGDRGDGCPVEFPGHGGLLGVIDELDGESRFGNGSGAGLNFPEPSFDRFWCDDHDPFETDFSPVNPLGRGARWLCKGIAFETTHPVEMKGRTPPCGDEGKCGHRPNRV